MSPTPSLSAQRNLLGARVLVVEDDAVLGSIVGRILEAHSAQVVVVGTAEDALSALRAERFDALVLDVNLPGRSGTDLLADIRRDPRHEMLPVVMVTGAVGLATRRLAAAAGVSAFLPKPFDAEELILCLTSLLNQKRIVDGLEQAGRVLVSLARTIEARDPYTAGHGQRVALIAGGMGTELKLGSDEMRALEEGGLLHDIGKVGIRDALLAKQGPLDSDEQREFRTHPEVGVRMVENLLTMAHTLPVIRSHHERWNGTGYPDRLLELDIPVVARITAYADVYDALASARPYRAAYPHVAAMDVIRDESRRGLLDPELLGAFERAIRRVDDRALT